MARPRLGDKVLERTSRIKTALQELGAISDPMTAFLLSQLTIDVDAIEELCQASAPFPPSVTTHTIDQDGREVPFPPVGAPVTLPRARKALPGKGKTT
jgi:hypothetical protein